jgi:formate hydrogenlyase transcriptional activator
MSDEAARTSAYLSRYEALLRTSKTLATHRTLAELLHVLAEQLHPLIPFDYLALALHDEPTDQMRLVVVEPTSIVPPFRSMPVAEHGPGAMAWQAQKAAVVPIPEEGPLHPTLEFMRSQGWRMTCFLPLTTARRKVGVLSFGSCSTTAYTEDVVAFMEQVAAQVAIAVDNGISNEEAQRYERELGDERDRLRFLLEVNNLLVSQLDYPALLKAICEAVQRVIEADQIGVALYDPESDQLRLDTMYEKSRGFTRADAQISLDKSAAGVTFQRGVTGVFRRSELEGLGWEDGASAMKAAGVESVCCVPLVTRSAKLGTLYIASSRPDLFSEDDVKLLGYTSAQIAIAIENARAYESMVSLNAQLIDEKQYLELELGHEFAEIVGNSLALRRVLKAVKTVAATDTTVLLLGETGTGKELLARAIHNLSRRRDRTFVRMSAAALPTGLLESELFGHEKGAFTGAVASKAGRLELANRGTLFLDEVGDIPAEVQPKLLRVLQEREFERLGSTRTQRVDVRIVAATNRDLEHMVEEGSFRSDLYYRLNVFPIEIPPLRERVQDISALARHFVAQCSRRLGRDVLTIPHDAMEALTAWNWPGNIRELQNVIERAVILSPGSKLVLPLQDIQPKTRRGVASPKPEPRPQLTPQSVSTFQDAERETILRALRESDGVVAGPTGAAARLGLRRTTLQSKMRKLGIRRPTF